MWQITRETICQDLAEAGVTCRPTFEIDTPPARIGWDDVNAEFERPVGLCLEHQICLPPPFVDGWRVEEQIMAGDG